MPERSEYCGPWEMGMTSLVTNISHNTDTQIFPKIHTRVRHKNILFNENVATLEIHENQLLQEFFEDHTCILFKRNLENWSLNF